MIGEKKRVDKLNINNIKFPDIHNPHEERSESRDKSKEKELTDPPKLRKAPNLNPIPVSNSTKDMVNFQKIVEIVEKTQGEFIGICRQIANIQERQQNFNNYILDQMQKSSQVKSQPLSSSSAPSKSIKEQVQFRDRYFFIDLPMTRKNTQWLEQLKRWINKLFTKTFSSAFHHFSRNQMTFQQTKIFCSMNILYNMVKLNKTHNITSDVIEALDQYLKNDVLIYLQKKYPLTEQTVINKNLESNIQEIDNLNGLSNNYFANSPITFQYRESANYNDLIMKMLNDIISKIDEKSPFHANKKYTNFLDFQKYITQIFSIVQEEEMDQPQSQVLLDVADFISDKIGRNFKSNLKDNAGGGVKESSKLKNQFQKQKYKNKVKDYTHYKIGRKIPQAVPLYTQKQIQSSNLAIKHPTIFRILTKWCEQLRRKFQQVGYYSNYSDNIKVQKGNIVNSLLFPMRTILDQELMDEQKQISKFLKNLSHSSYEMQRQLLQKETAKFQWYDIEEQELQKICGRYSIEMLNSLYSYLIAYLNRLIHGLMIVAKKFYQRCQLDGNSNWPSPPNLLTFTIGDLMRCKISSKQKQILRIYEQIRQISSRNPQKLKIVRIKNRLNLSTNDILLNIRFNDLILCQIQLAVKTQASQFIKCSNTFCHYLYELQRSPFGSIAELCNIWAYLDRRAQSYRQAMQTELQKQYIKNQHSCESTKRSPYDKPFICHICDLAYYHNNFLRPHLQCFNCKKVICAKCQLKEERQGIIVESLIANKKLRKNVQYMVNRIQASSKIEEGSLPEFGICIYIESKFPKIQIFRLISYKNKRYILGRTSTGQIYEIDKIQKHKQLATFMRKYVIFKLNNHNNQHLQLSIEQAIQQYILPKILRQFYRQEKESLVLGDKLSNNLIQSVLKVGSAESKLKITKLFLDNNHITDIGSIAKDFFNLQILQLSYNKIKKFDELSLLNNLKSLSLVSLGMASIPESIFKIKSIEELCLSHNSITCVQSEIQKLTRLKILELSNNSIQELPSNIGNCSDIIILRCQNNRISSLPSSIGRLANLRTLYLKHNEISTAPQQFGQLMVQEIDLSFNKFESLPLSIGKLRYLQIFDLSHNSITEINENIHEMKELVDLNLQGNKKLQNLPNNFALINKLEQLNLSKCGFTQIPIAVTQIKSLKTLLMDTNKMTRLKKEFSNLDNLQVIDLSNNQLIADDTLRDIFSKMSKLTKIKINHNHIAKFPNFFFCESIKHIDISYNELEQIDNSDLAGLNNLQYLNLSHNNITKLTEAIVSIKTLKDFDVSFNKIKQIGSNQNEDHISIWPQIKRINLENNQLTQVPVCLLRSQRMGNLENLTTINIKSNNVEKLPNQLQGLRKLKEFNVANNNVKMLSQELQNFLKSKKTDLDVNDMKILTSQDFLSPVRKRMGLSKRESRNAQKMMK